jgi:hypothetical protein
LDVLFESYVEEQNKPVLREDLYGFSFKRFQVLETDE